MTILGCIYFIVHYDTCQRLLQIKNEQYLSNLITLVKQEKRLTGARMVKAISPNIESFRYIDVFEAVDNMVQQDTSIHNALIIDSNGYVHHQTKSPDNISSNLHFVNMAAGLIESKIMTQNNQTFLICGVPIIIQNDLWGMLKLIFRLDSIDREKRRLESHLGFLLFYNMIWIFGVWISGVISIGIALYIIMSRHSRRLVQMGSQIQDFDPSQDSFFSALAARTDETGFLARQIKHTCSCMTKEIKEIRSQCNQLHESYEDSYSITEKTRTLLQEVQTGLKEWEYQSRTMFDWCQESLVFISCQGQILEANPQFLKLCGYAMKDIHNLNFVELLPKEFQPDFTQNFMRQIQSQTQSAPLETAILRKDQTYLYMSIKGRLFFKNNTDPHKILIAGIDMSWNRQTQYILKDLELLLKQDLKDALARVIGLSELMAVKTQVGKKDLCDWSQIIHQNARAMLDNIQQALDIFKLEANEYKLNCRNCNLCFIFQKLSIDFSSITVSRSIEIHYLMNNAPLTWDQSFEIWGDCNLLYAMFTRLLNDIIEQSPEYQKITISFQQQQDLHITIHCDIPLSDNTVNDFFARPKDESEKHKGAYIALLIANAHGGTIGIRNSSEQQTQFILILPDNNPTGIADHENYSKRILIADDSANSHLLMDYYLSDYNDWLRVTAKNGQEAIERFQEMPFDVILMDIEMPELNGIAAIRAVRDIEKNLPERTEQKARILIITADTSDETKEKVIQAGADAVLCKPVEANHLIEMIKKE